MLIITRFFQLVAVVFAGFAIYLALIRLPQHVNGKVLAEQKAGALEREKLGFEIARLRSTKNENEREVIRAKISAVEAGRDRVLVEQRKTFLETQFANLQTLIKSMETDQSAMALREGVLRDEIKKTQTLYSNTEADRRVMAVAMGRQTEANNRLATENGTLKTALAALNLPQNTRSATPQVSRVALIPTFVRQPALVIQQTPAPSAAPVIPVAPRGALGGALGYQANFQPSPTGHSGVVRKFDNARSEVYVDIGKKHGVSEGSVLMIQRGERTIGNANVTFAFGESALGRMQGDGKPAAGDKAVKIR